MSLATPDEVIRWLGLSGKNTADDDFLVSIVMPSVDRMIADFLGYSPAQATRTEYYPARINLTQREQFIDGWERSGTNKVVPIDRYRSERRALILRHVPVTAIVGVWENPDAWLSSPADFSSQYLLTVGDDYSLDVENSDNISRTGLLIRSNGPWIVAERCIKVTYTAGFTADQLGADYGVFKHAYLMQCQVAYNTAKIHRMQGKLGSQPGLLASESLGDWSTSYDTQSAAALYSMTNRLAPGVARMLENYFNPAMFF